MASQKAGSMNKLNFNPLQKFGFDEKGWASLLNWLSLMRNTLSQNLFKDVSQISGVASATPTTIYTIPNIGTTGTWLVSCNLGNKNDTTNFSAYAVILSDGSSARIALSNNAAQQTITLSGLNVQSTQSSGSAQTLYTSVTRIA